MTLGIETSCDDTGVAVLSGESPSFEAVPLNIENKKFPSGENQPCGGEHENNILAELLSSQIKDHAKFGGVVPEFAARKHLENILPLINAALSDADINGKDLDLIAVTRGPGLMGSLMVGVMTARALSQAWNVPIIGVNHLEGHIFASLVDLKPDELKPPFLSLIVSGGHTQIILVNNFGDYKLLGETRDDAAGEAFDKAARVLGLPYPGGPEIDKLAQNGDPYAFDFPVPLKNTHEIEFSFSGLKTALLWRVKKFKDENIDIDNNRLLCDLCASFQRAVTEALIAKIKLAVKLTGIKNITVSGGVAANSALRNALVNSREAKNWRAWLPKFSRCTDNAVMIAMAGKNAWFRGEHNDADLSPDPSLNIG